jgi:hypothetical protein
MKIFTICSFALIVLSGFARADFAEMHQFTKQNVKKVIWVVGHCDSQGNRRESFRLLTSNGDYTAIFKDFALGDQCACDPAAPKGDPSWDHSITFLLAMVRGNTFQDVFTHECSVNEGVEFPVEIGKYENANNPNIGLMKWQNVSCDDPPPAADIPYETVCE